MVLFVFVLAIFLAARLETASSYWMRYVPKHNRNLCASSWGENFAELKRICPNFRCVPNTSAEYGLAVELEKGTAGDRPIDMSLDENRKLLSGLWKAVITTLPMTSLKSFSQVALLKTGTDLDEAPVTANDVFQYVEDGSDAYDNYIAITPSHLKSGLRNLSVVTRGRVSYPNKGSHGLRGGGLNRLGVDFYANEVVMMPDASSYASFTAVRKVEQDKRVLCQAMGLADDSKLKNPMNVQGWSDCTYLSEDGRIRIMRGNNRNLYVLEKVL